jgi:hypothetical protein
MRSAAMSQRNLWPYDHEMDNAKDEVVAKLVKQIEEGLAVKEEGFIRAVFNEYKDPLEETLKFESFRPALLKLRIDVETQNTLRDFRTIHIDHEKGLSFEEFKQYVDCRSSLLEEFARTIPVWRLLVEAVPSKKEFNKNSDFGGIRTMASLSAEEIDTMVDAMRDGLKKMLWHHCSSLRAAMDAAQEQTPCTASAKFISELASEDIHLGEEQNLTDRVGARTHPPRQTPRAPHANTTDLQMLLRESSLPSHPSGVRSGRTGFGPHQNPHRLTKARSCSLPQAPPT